MLLKDTSNKSLYDTLLSMKGEKAYILNKWKDKLNLDDTVIFRYVFQFTFYELINNEMKMFKWKLLHNILQNNVLLAKWKISLK